MTEDNRRRETQTVLISEPNEDVCALLEVLIGRRYRPRVASQPPTAVDGVDIAVIEPSGTDAMQLARAMRRRGVPIIFLSIYPASRELLDLEPVAYLEKPFTYLDLERALLTAELTQRPTA